MFIFGGSIKSIKKVIKFFLIETLHLRLQTDLVLVASGPTLNAIFLHRL
jgi:hypothetical protein